MTSTADLNYIAAVSALYNPRKSTKMSSRASVCKSAPLSRTEFSLKRMENNRNILSGNLTGLEKRKQKSKVLDELLLVYGTNSYKYFEFSKLTSTWISEVRPRIGTAWLCNNEACRQMYSTSVLYPRKTFGRSSTLFLPRIPY